MIHIHVWLERIFQAQHTTYDIHISAAVPANPSQYLSREQQHHHLPRPGRHHLLSNGKGAKFGQVSTNQAQSKRKAFQTLFPLTHCQIMVFIVSKTSLKYSHAKIVKSRKLTRWQILSHIEKLFIFVSWHNWNLKRCTEGLGRICYDRAVFKNENGHNLYLAGMLIACGIKGSTS